jgi:hypothetical protein
VSAVLVHELRINRPFLAGTAAEVRTYLYHIPPHKLWTHNGTFLPIYMEDSRAVLYRVTINEIDTFNVIKTVSVVDTQFA